MCQGNSKSLLFMQKKIFSFKSVAGASLLLAVLLLSACNKNSPGNNNNTNDAGLLPFNLAPGTSVSIGVAGNAIITGALNFPNYTGQYVPVSPGSKIVDTYKYGQKDSVYASTAYEFSANKFYSLFLVGFNGHYKNIIVPDRVDSSIIGTSKAYVRFINGIADSSDQHFVVSRGTTSALDTTLKYTGVASVRPIDPGDVTFAVLNGTDIKATKTVTLEANKLYSIILYGVPSATDDNNKVKVTYIINGSL